MTFALDDYPTIRQCPDMDSSEEILIALRARGIKQEAIAKVLGVKQPNVATLFNPATKTGKPRKLSYDEGKRLIEAFDLDDEPNRQTGFNVQTLAPILQALLPLVPSGNVSESAVEALALGLRHALALLPAHGAIPANEDQLDLAVRAAVVRFHEAWPARPPE